MICASFVLAAAAVHFAATAQAGIRIVEDEVIFTLNAPGAKSVYLVGDFNNWNPTVEKMVKVDDHFEIGLFLVEGDYRYKFVVDGKWINDPDNPPRDPLKGSPLFLAERDEMIVLKDASFEGLPPGAVLEPSARYIGAFRWDDGDFEADQVVDVDIGVKARVFTSYATFKSLDDSWKLSPLETDVFLYRGRLGIQLRRAHITAFEKDSVWTSSDPFGLVGGIGIYNYRFGYGEKGAALDIPFSKSLHFRALYADRPGGGIPSAPVVPANAVADFMASSSSDTSFYAFQPGYGDADIFGMEVRLEVGGYEVGYVKRSNRGFNPGLLNLVEKQDTLFEITTFQTREQWSSYAVWAGADVGSSVRATVGYAEGSGFLNRFWRSTSIYDDLAELNIGREAQPWDSKELIQRSRRILGQVVFEKDRLECAVNTEQDMVDFKGVAFDDAEAEQLRSELSAEYAGKTWDASARIEYTDRKYGNSPALFHFDSPARNFWLDSGDRFWPETMAGFDLKSYSLIRLGFSWHPAASLSEEEPDRARFSYGAEVGATTDGVFESLEHGYARLSVERYLTRWLYLQVDSRGSLYDKPIWGERKTFLSGYLEAGYRNNWAEFSIGFGFDPIVLDPVRNEYFDIGRIEHLRGAVLGSPDRDSAGEIGKRLLDLERELEKDRSVKLECILLF